MDDVVLNGSTVVVTGANCGIGKATARDLARRGARVILACRNQSKGDQARTEIINDTQNNDVIVKLLDLSSLQSIRDFVDDFCRSESRLDILVNNAAILSPVRQLTADGFEIAFGVNYLGHFYLTYLLLDKLKQSAPSRVVSVSSKAYEFSGLDFNDLQFERKWDYFKAYARSKTANILFSAHLSKLLNGTGVTTYSVHPGSIETELQRDVRDQCFVRFIHSSCGQCLATCLGCAFISVEEGAQTVLYCCLEPSLAQETGHYYEKCRRHRPKRHARDPEICERLWTISCQLCSVSPQL